jgi:iron complex outermembrane receptor protein
MTWEKVARLRIVAAAVAIPSDPGSAARARCVAVTLSSNRATRPEGGKEMQYSRTFSRLMIGASILACPAVLHAQATAPADSDSQEIVVTALKTNSTALKTPAALTVLSGNDLQAKGVVNLSDIQNVAPSVNIAQGRDGVQVAVRGVTTTDTSSKGEQDIAFSVDGAYIGRGNARGGAFFDVDHVEVLRGPQGTLYGRSSTGGAINVVTAKPKLGVTEGYVRAEYGNYDTKRGQAAINVPLGDTLALRLAGTFNNRDGYSRPIDNNVNFFGTTYRFSASQGQARNDQKDAAGRASLLFKPTDTFSLRLTATVGHQGGVGGSPALETQLTAHNDSGDAALVGLVNPVRSFVDSNYQMYDAALNWNFGPVQLDVVGSHQMLNFRQQNSSVQDTAANGGGALYACFGNPCDTRNANVAGLPPFGSTFQLYFQQNRVKTDQVEARISNGEPGAIDYVVGANYFKEAAGENGQSWNAQIVAPLDTGTYVFQAGPINVTTHKAYGVFGQATWHATEQLGVVAGLRQTHDEVSRAGRFALPYNFAAGFPPPPFPDANGSAICHYPDNCVGAINNGGQTDNKLTWRLGLNYQADPANLFYASVATGFKGGGFNDYDPATSGVGQYKPASLTAYELGYKGRPLRGLTLSSSAFYYDFSRFQVNSGVNFPNGAGFGLFTTTTPVEIYGLENELNWQLARSTTFDGSLTLLHSSFRNFLTGANALTGNPINFTGKAVDLAPGMTFTLGLTHNVAVGEGGNLKFHADLKYSSAYYLSDYNNGVRYRQKASTRSNASVTYELDDARYTLQLYVENIENKVQRTSMQGYAGTYGGTANNGIVNEASDPANNLAFYTTTPRFYGVRAGMKF